MLSLKKIRKQHNKTQNEVAKMLKIDQTTYSGYETGKSNPSLDVLIHLADFYHITIDELVEHEIPYLINKSTLTENQLELFEMIQKLSDSNCNLVKAYLIGLLTAEEEKQNIIKRFTKGK